ncbi:hypothetical protein RJT34_10533 [Clitoria ternatea]|uniref:Amino acid transporter transmembrane domain-containing protein n=1 Tax=Clitoria ternatea TaxID=43366 RepID=A0AAN9PV74_CLITE
MGDSTEGNTVDAATAAAKQKAIDEWLPVTASRHAKWWYSAFHNLTAMVGAGVLSLPYAMSHLGWGPGATMLILSWIITFYTLWQMVQMHEMVPGKRFDRYHELGQEAFGEKLGLWIVIPQQIVVEVGTCIVYMITGGKSLKKIHDSLCPDCKDIRTTFWIMIFASVNFVLAQCPNFNSISIVSFAAAVMSITYSIIAWGTSIKKGVEPNVNYSITSYSTADSVFNFLSALGDIAFAYAAHNVVMEIQATIPSTPETPSKKPMWKGCVFAYLGVAFCYFPVSFIGYYVFGNKVDDNILISLERPVWLIAAANLFVVLHVIGGYQVSFNIFQFIFILSFLLNLRKFSCNYCLISLSREKQVFAMPVFDMMETYLVKTLNFKPCFSLRFVTRSIFVALTMLIGMCIPFFGSLLGFLGGFALAPTSYFLPCIIWLKLKKPKRFSLSWTINWFCIIFGVLLMTLSPIGALRNIIISAKNYKLFS